jgi:hypothetical protein
LKIGFSRRSAIGPDMLLFVVIWIAAVVPGILAVRGLTWPSDIDGFRDMQEALRTGDMATFRPLQQQFQVTHVLWRGNTPPRLGVPPVFKSGPLELYDAC